MKYPLAIHVGHGKTGTSFIQSVLAINAELLSSYGLNYPVYALEDGRAKQGLISSGNGMLITEDKWQAKGPTLVSSEVLFERLLQDAALRQRISSRHGRIKIILYTRDLFDYLISGWGQYIKRHNGVLAFNDYMLDGVAQGNYHVYPLVLEWIKLAEREQFELVIVNYSRHKSDLIESFLLAALPSSASSMWSACKEQAVAPFPVSNLATTSPTPAMKMRSRKPMQVLGKGACKRCVNSSARLPANPGASAGKMPG